MLPKKHRLKRPLIEKVLREGKKVNTPNISLKYLLISAQPSALAFVVPLKTAKAATIRNKLKRRGRAIVFNLLPRIKKGCLGVIFFEKGSETLTFSELEQKTLHLFKKAGFFALNNL